VPLPGLDVNRIHQDFARRIFAVELSEILMGFTGYGWGAGSSNGEGLSAIIGALFYPEAYYGSGQGPRVNQWLNGVPAANGKPAQAPRLDWVSQTEGTDQNFVSFGCAILFINYLVYERGFSLAQVVRAGGSNLAQTFAALTGEPAAQAFVEFSSLVAKHVPANQKTFVANDNVFPLRDPPQRALFSNQGYPDIINTLRDPAKQSFKVKPGFICAEDFYDYYVDREFVEVSEYIRTFGFMNASFAWMVNGVQLTSVNRWDTVNISVAFSTKQPDGTTSTTMAATAFRYIIVSSWNKSALFLKNTSTIGNCTLTVNVVAREAAFPAETSTNLNDTLDVDIITFVPGEKLRRDRKRCNPNFYAIDTSIRALSETLRMLKDRPDPPNERAILQVIAAVQQVQNVMSSLGESAGMTRTELLRELKVPGTLVSFDARASETTIARIKAPDQQTNVIDSPGTT
jgi:hypothetical protein